MSRRCLALCLVSLVIGACASAPVALLHEPTQAAPVQAAGSQALSLAALQNATYRSPDWGEFQLVNGAYRRPPLAPGESPDTYMTQMFGPIAYGDLNGDGLEDAAVFLTTQSGGTGHFIELAAVINRGGRAANAATLPLGDRVGVEAARIEAGVITLDMRVHGPNDGLCCASQFETRRFRLEAGQLSRLP
jgi:hypothetical protein